MPLVSRIHPTFLDNNNKTIFFLTTQTCPPKLATRIKFEILRKTHFKVSNHYHQTNSSGLTTKGKFTY